uniref:USP domain-containing protein n=1 Tax=Poecilia mexicana TaxID=48701 RepID=A0A3B3XEU9_9TELE
MSGESIGLEALASLQAGYLGKVQERAASLEDCPWCNSKGLTFALRSYRINLQESITLCTNPQCLFPLVTRPLEDVLASLDPVDPTVGNKRKNALAVEDVIESPLKRQRLSEHGDLRPQSVSYVPVSSLENCSLNSVINGHNGNPNTGSEIGNGYHKESPDVKTADWDDGEVQDRDDPAPPACSSSVGSSSDVLLACNGAEPPSPSPHLVYPDAAKQNNVPPLNTCSRSTSSPAIYPDYIKTSSPLCNEPTTKESLEVDVSPCRDVNGFRSESRDSLDKFVSVPKQLLWRNSNNLCWLDSLLAVLVNCKSLRKLRPERQPQRSSVWQLLRKHEDICAAVQEHQQTDKDGVPRVPSHVLQNAHVDLQSLRMSVFKLLQPKLQCKLGQRETPVFAMPLLLKLDSWVERLFQATFLWEFKCSTCKVVTKERVEKTLPTFTNIVPDWTPLNAAHLAPCNACSKKNERRTMSLESVPPVFALHFVEGLPHNNVRNYAFSFQGKRYSVTAIIQYSQRLNHFITWMYNEDGSWLEYDDLKNACETHQHLQIPTQEIHVVFWEEEEETQPSFCSLSSVLLEPLPIPEPSEAPEPLELPESVCPVQSNTAAVTEQTSTVSSINLSPPLLTQKDRWSYILSRHPVNKAHKNISHPPPTQNGVTSEVKPSHPNPVKKPPIPARVPKPPLSTEERTGLPPKAAEMYGGYGAKKPNPISSGLSDTETLRYKLLKKLKAKKKKLAKLNQLLGTGGGAHLRPDSTDLNSPSTVSSSTYDGYASSDLLSPAMTASSLSPDSTGFLEMLVSGQDGANQLDCVVSGAGAVTPTNCQTTQHEGHNFLEEFDFFSHFLS